MTTPKSKDHESIARLFGRNVPTKGRDVSIGKRVVFGKNVLIYDNVTIEQDSVIGPNVIIGEPAARSYESSDYRNPSTVVGQGSIVRSGTVIYAGCKLGSGLRTGHYATIRENTVCGENCSFGTYATSDGDVKIGDRSRLHYFTFVCKKSKIGDDVWLFPGAMLLEDLHPPCGRCAGGPTLGDRAVIGAAAVVMPGIRVGEDAVVAAGSVVTKDVPDGMLVVGQPGRIVGKASKISCSTGDISRPYPWKTHYKRAR